MNTCCVRNCENTETTEHYIPSPQEPVAQQPTLYIVRVCEPCGEWLIGKPVQFNYYQAGRIGFVNEIYNEK